MNEKAPTPDDLLRHDFSLLLVTPKPCFLQLVTEYAQQAKKGRLAVYCPEENTVVFIPKIDRFSVPNSFQEFLDFLKPRLLRSELARFGFLGESFKDQVTKKSFDVFFEVEIRDTGYFLNELK